AGRVSRRQFSSHGRRKMPHGGIHPAQHAPGALPQPATPETPAGIVQANSQSASAPSTMPTSVITDVSPIPGSIRGQGSGVRGQESGVGNAGTLQTADSRLTGVSMAAGSAASLTPGPSPLTPLPR